MQLMVINGPNLNKLGSRDPEQYGKGSYMELLEMVEGKSNEKISIRCFQSNSEGKIPVEAVIGLMPHGISVPLSQHCIEAPVHYRQRAIRLMC